jgi:hypothetical protein
VAALDAGPAVDAAASAAAAPTCAEPTLAADPSAPADNRCGSGGAAVDLSNDAAHCGACNHACGETARCADGVCSFTRLFAKDTILSGIVVGDMAYAVDARRRFVRAPTTAGALEPFDNVALETGTDIRRLQATATYLYVSTTASPLRVSLADGAHEVLTLEAGAELGGLVAASAGSYFYATSKGVEKHREDGKILLNAPSPGTKDVVADGDDAYWVASVGSTASLYGPFPKTDVLVSGPAIEALALDADYIYYVDTVSHFIRRVPRRGGSAQTIAREPAKIIGALAVDGDNVYWTADRGYVDGWMALRVSKCGGVPVVLARVQPTLSQLSFDATRMFVSRAPSPAAAELSALTK